MFVQKRYIRHGVYIKYLGTFIIYSISLDSYLFSFHDNNQWSILSIGIDKILLIQN